MQRFPVHTIDTAPEASRPALRQLQSAFGLLPNIAGAMANSPVLINGLVGLFGAVHGGSFAEPEIQVVLLTDAVANGAAWAVAFHTALALQQGVAPATVQAIREGRLPEDARLAALSGLARALIETRGQPGEAVVGRFLAAGFREDQVLEAVAIVAASTMTNYAAKLAQPPLEAPFAPHAWAG